ncbi:MAG: FHIPEP family type III secretion protein, partial [Bdellovibrionales bacterium]|nr:FHIPEP family type III secretion protein [Bdellovibrionales bacterium]
MRRLRQIPRVITSALLDVGAGGALVAVLVLILIALLLVPLPRPLLDILIVCNVLVAMLLLLVGLHTSETRQFFSFPTILLLSTLFRLALNVSSTRLILLNGDAGLDAAGQVIQAFGEFVVRGDFLVGAVIFAIIAVVNFVVIAKGSARVAEVAARFTLDALPGKQLAIDADLRAGLISKEDARRARAALAEESQFYGAMDGAMRFVQGDAIAGFVITFINAVGGVAIGVSRGMDIASAINTFGILTIGDGLASIVPSLLISVCAGVVVTRVSTRAAEQPGGRIVRELNAHPRAMVITAGVLIVLGVLPGLPIVPFFLVGFCVLAWAGWLLAAHSARGELEGIAIPEQQL